MIEFDRVRVVHVTTPRSCQTLTLLQCNTVGYESLTEIVEYEQVKRNHPEIEEVVSTVATYFAIEKCELIKLQQGRYSKNQPRLVAIYLCQIAGVYKLEEIANAFGFGHYASVSSAISRLKHAMSNDEQLRSDVSSLVRRYQPTTKT